MTNKFIFIIMVIFVASVFIPSLISNSCAKETSIASSNQIFSLSEKDFDLSEAILILSSEAYKDIFNRDINISFYKAKIDEMARTVNNRIRFRRSPSEIIGELNKLIYGEQKFEADNPFTGDKDILRESLVTILDTKQGNCFGMSLLYLCLTERAKLPLHGVIMPGHMFVRYNSDGLMINIETTLQGIMTNDNEFYLRNYGIPDGNSVYLKNITKREVLGTFLTMLGLSYKKAHLYDKAEYYFKKSIEMNPGINEGFVNLGRLYYENNRYSEAISLYQTALLVDRDDFNVHFNLANALKKQNRYNEAIDEYARAVRCPSRRGGPDFADAYYNWALVYFDNHMRDQEIIQYNNALAVNPDHYGANSNLSTAYLQVGMLGEAKKYLEKAISINPGGAQDHYNLGVIYMEENRLDLSVKEFTKARQLGYQLPTQALQIMKTYEEDALVAR